MNGLGIFFFNAIKDGDREVSILCPRRMQFFLIQKFDTIHVHSIFDFLFHSFQFDFYYLSFHHGTTLDIAHCTDKNFDLVPKVSASYVVLREGTI